MSLGKLPIVPLQRGEEGLERLLVSDWVVLLHREKLNLLVRFFVNGTDDAACDVLYLVSKTRRIGSYRQLGVEEHSLA
jgi:hypothetical protein